MARGTPTTRLHVYAAIDSERAYQEMRKKRDNGDPAHSIEEYLVYVQDYLTEALHTASRVWGPAATTEILPILRKVVALGIACMEDHGAPPREGFVQEPDIERLAKCILKLPIGEPSQNEGAIDTAIRLLNNAYQGNAAKVNNGRTE